MQWTDEGSFCMTAMTMAGDAYGSLRTALRRTPVVPPAPPMATKEMPLWRLLLQFRRNALSTWGAPAYELDIVGRPFMGRQSILVNAPAGIRHVLVDNHANYIRTPGTLRILHPLLGDGLFLAEGESWRQQRRLTAPAFAPRSMDVVARHAAEVAAETADTLRSGPSHAVNLLGILQRLALEVAGRALFSTAMRKHGPVVRAAMARYGELSRPNFLDFVLPRDATSPFDFRRKAVGSEFKKVIDAIIAERAALPPTKPPRDLFDALAYAQDEESGATVSPELLRDQVATLIIAGHETTALALFWSFYLLSISPEVQQAVADEAAGVDLGSDNANEAAESLPLTRAVVQEALRLYPPAYTIVRMADGPDEIMGREVPKGTLVVVSPWVLHRHKQHWQDPLTFDPTRFLPDAPPPARFTYLPFGVGPRVCIGQQFALIEATLVLARLTREFRFEIVGSNRIRPIAVVTTVPERLPAFRIAAR